MNFVSLTSNKTLTEVTEETILELAKKAAHTLRTKAGDLMITANIKGSGMGYYWSPYDKKIILVPRKAEYYVLPWQKDEKGRKYLYLPHYLTSGTIVCVDADEIDFLGFN